MVNKDSQKGNYIVKGMQGGSRNLRKGGRSLQFPFSLPFPLPLPPLLLFLISIGPLNPDRGSGER